MVEEEIKLVFKNVEIILGGTFSMFAPNLSLIEILLNTKFGLYRKPYFITLMGGKKLIGQYS